MIPGIVRAENAGLTTTNNLQGYGTVITAAGSTNTKGSWTELIASTTSDCCFLEVYIVQESLGLYSVSVDIGVGAAASEIVIIPDLYTSPSFNNFMQCKVQLPMHIQAGTRIAARCQSSTASKTVAVHVILHNGCFPWEVVGVDALNFNAASTTGTTLTPDTTAGVKGSYSQLIASTARDYSGVFATWDYSAGLRQQYKIDVAIGAAASEVIIIPDRQIYTGDTTNNVGVPTDAIAIPFVPIHIPAGQRVAARASTSKTTGEAFKFSLYGVF